MQDWVCGVDSPKGTGNWSPSEAPPTQKVEVHSPDESPPSNKDKKIMILTDAKYPLLVVWVHGAIWGKDC